jgi:hypothetical protein
MMTDSLKLSLSTSTLSTAQMPRRPLTNYTTSTILTVMVSSLLKSSHSYTAENARDK